MNVHFETEILGNENVRHMQHLKLMRVKIL